MEQPPTTCIRNSNCAQRTPISVLSNWHCLAAPTPASLSVEAPEPVSGVPLPYRYRHITHLANRTARHVNRIGRHVGHISLTSISADDQPALSVALQTPAGLVRGRYRHIRPGRPRASRGVHGGRVYGGACRGGCGEWWCRWGGPGHGLSDGEVCPSAL